MGDLEVLEAVCLGHGDAYRALDDFDNSPLYYASLCGREVIVDFVLRAYERERRTIAPDEMLRCVTNALNQYTRALLQQKMTLEEILKGKEQDAEGDEVVGDFIYDMPPAKRHATTSSPLSIPLGAPEPPVNSPVIPPAQSPATTPAKSSARTPAQSPAKTPAQSPATTPAKSPAKTPAKAPAKSPRKTPTKSPTNTPAKSPAKSPAQAPAKGQTPRKKRARKEVAASPIPSLRPLRSCTVRAAEVDIYVGDDRLSSGDEDDFQVDEGDESDIEGTSETSAGEEEEITSDEEDAVDLSAGTPFDQMNKDQLSEHAQTGWTTYFEDSFQDVED
ncbi:hypothetical protein PInf_010897 [Phytophthora infestans]|nr:hypothetical protein PInf_010897 [Phytophthora infestans]